MCNNALGPTQHLSTWAVHIASSAPACCQLYVLLTHILQARGWQCYWYMLHNVHDDVICCKVSQSNYLTNTFLHFVWSQTTKFKDCQHFRVYSISPNLETGYPAQQLIKCAHQFLHSNYSGKSLIQLQLSKSLLIWTPNNDIPGYFAVH